MTLNELRVKRFLSLRLAEDSASDVLHMPMMAFGEKNSYDFVEDQINDGRMKDENEAWSSVLETFHQAFV